MTSCKSRAICGLILPRHEIAFENDSIFRYSKWYLDTDTTSFSYYSEGTYKKINKTSYILNSNSFNPDSLNLNCTVKDDPTIKGFRLKISTEMFDDIFDFHQCIYEVDLDSLKFEFFTSSVDTIISSIKPKEIGITLTIPPDYVVPNCRYSIFKTLPVKLSDSNFTTINVWFPDVSKYFHWYSLNNVLLTSFGRGNKKGYKIGDDNWPVIIVEQ